MRKQRSLLICLVDNVGQKEKGWAWHYVIFQNSVSSSSKLKIG
jgi:hypothetical protein